MRQNERQGVGASRSTGEIGERVPANPVEGRGSQITEPLKGKTSGTPSPINVSTKLQRIAELAKAKPGIALDNLAHHIDVGWLRAAFDRTRKDGAVGVDGQTADEYRKELECNLQHLLERAKSGTYRAPPVRRVEIPKAGKRNETRPLGIPTFEDKVLQRAVVMVLEPIYEQEFLECSWGFRPRRSAHQAIQRLWDQTTAMGGGWVVDLDIRRFFDTLDHERLREILRRRVRDGVLVRLVGKWLKAGVLTRGGVIHPSTGTPQGGVISPLLANVYLHEVLDKWFELELRPTLQSEAHLTRYADDAIILCKREDDAKRVLAELSNRLSAFGLSLHPEKTRLVDFRRPKSSARRGAGSFSFLGFTHFWGRSRFWKWIVRRKTAKDRFSRAVRTANEWCRAHRHLPVREQHRLLSRKLQEHDAYFGITGNSGSLVRLRFMVQIVWKRWLHRRSQRGNMPWDRFNELLVRYPFPPPRVVHSVYRAVKP